MNENMNSSINQVEGLSNELVSALEFFVVVFAELAILFVLISFVVSVINQKLPPEKIKKMLKGNRGYGVAVALGAVTPFCSCSTLPMTIGLIQARAAFGPIMAFLFTSPLLNPFIVGLFWVSFGAKITVIYFIFVVILSTISGFLLEKFNFERFVKADLLKPSCSSGSSKQAGLEYNASGEAGLSNAQQHQVSSSSSPGTNKLNLPPNSGSIKWNSLLKETIKQFFSFAPYMVVGVLVGAILHGYVPQELFENLAGQNIFWLIPASAIIGVFLYVRASTMVPIASSLAAKGMAMGAIMSLTIAGAGASLPEMIMMKRMFHWPLVVAFILLVFSTACVTGFAVELL